MFRYIATAWNADDPSQTMQAHELIARCQQQSTPWEVALRHDGLVVLYADTAAYPKPQVFHNGRGVILGVLFRRQDSADEHQNDSEDVSPGYARAVLNDREVEQILASRGQALVDRYWGDYVAFFCDEDEISIHVLRGPASTLPCLHCCYESIHLYFSWMESCAQLITCPFSIDWPHLARGLMGSSQSARTDLQEVREILPGIREDLRAGQHNQRVMWNPVALANAPQFEHPAEAARALRSVTRSCVHAWSSLYSSVLVGLSGGLDSSIVLACLTDASSKQNITCLTQYADASSDERVYARLAAQHAGCTLIERERSGYVDFRTAVHAIRMETSPGLRLPAVDRIESEVALRLGAGAVMRGNGGDEIFCRNAPGLYVSDFIREHGLRRDVLGLAMHAATTEGSTAWRVLARALWDACIPRRWGIEPLLAQDITDATLLHPEVLANLRTTKPSSDVGAGTSTMDAPVGKLFQISLVCAKRPFYGPFTRLGDPANISPLLSQPLIEVCLKIPTHFQMLDRRDRALARRAFAQDIPPAIAQRRDKGLAENVARNALADNFPFMREMLLDGVIANQNIIDRPRLEAALSSAPSSNSVTTVPLFDLLGAEIWARALGERRASLPR